MRRVINRAGRAAALLAVLTIAASQAALAADRDGGRDRGLFDRFERAKHWIVRALDRIGLPPG